MSRTVAALIVLALFLYLGWLWTHPKPSPHDIYKHRYDSAQAFEAYSMQLRAEAIRAAHEQGKPYLVTEPAKPEDFR